MVSSVLPVLAVVAQVYGQEVAEPRAPPTFKLPNIDSIADGYTPIGVVGSFGGNVTGMQSITIEFSQPIIALGEDNPSSPRTATSHIRLAPVEFACSPDFEWDTMFGESFIPRVAWPQPNILRVDPPTGSQWPDDMDCKLRLNPELVAFDGTPVAVPPPVLLRSSPMTAHIEYAFSPLFAAAKIPFDARAWAPTLYNLAVEANITIGLGADGKLAVAAPAATPLATALATHIAELNSDASELHTSTRDAVRAALTSRWSADVPAEVPMIMAPAIGHVSPSGNPHIKVVFSAPININALAGALRFSVAGPIVLDAKACYEPEDEEKWGANPAPATDKAAIDEAVARGETAGGADGTDSDDKDSDEKDVDASAPVLNRRGRAAVRQQVVRYAVSEYRCLNLTLYQVAPRQLNEIVIPKGTLLGVHGLPLRDDLVIPFVGMQPALIAPAFPTERERGILHPNVKVFFPRGIFLADPAATDAGTVATPVAAGEATTASNAALSLAAAAATARTRKAVTTADAVGFGDVVTLRICSAAAGTCGSILKPTRWFNEDYSFCFSNYSFPAYSNDTRAHLVVQAAGYVDIFGQPYSNVEWAVSLRPPSCHLQASSPQAVFTLAPIPAGTPANPSEAPILPVITETVMKRGVECNTSIHRVILDGSNVPLVLHMMNILHQPYAASFPVPGSAVYDFAAVANGDALPAVAAGAALVTVNVGYSGDRTYPSSVSWISSAALDVAVSNGDRASFHYIRVTDMLTGEGAPNATLVLHAADYSGVFNASVTTDPHGAVAIPRAAIPYAYGTLRIVAVVGNRVSAPASLSLSPASEPGTRAVVTVDRGLYKPGDTVHISGVLVAAKGDIVNGVAPTAEVLDANLAAIKYAPAGDRKVTVSVESFTSARTCAPTEVNCDTFLPVQQFEVVTDAATGVFSGSFTVPQGALASNHQSVTVFADGANAVATFKVGDPRLPSFSLDVSVPDAAASLLSAGVGWEYSRRSRGAATAQLISTLGGADAVNTTDDAVAGGATTTVPAATTDGQTDADPAVVPVTYFIEAMSPPLPGYMPATMQIPGGVHVKVSQLGGAAVAGAVVHVTAVGSFKLEGARCETQHAMDIALGIAEGPFDPVNACCSVESRVEYQVRLLAGEADLVLVVPIPDAIGRTAEAVQAAAADGVVGTVSYITTYLSPANDALNETATAAIVGSAYTLQAAVLDATALPGSLTSVRVIMSRDTTLSSTAAATIPVSLTLSFIANEEELAGVVPAAAEVVFEAGEDYVEVPIDFTMPENVAFRVDASIVAHVPAIGAPLPGSILQLRKNVTGGKTKPVWVFDPVPPVDTFGVIVTSADAGIQEIKEAVLSLATASGAVNVTIEDQTVDITEGFVVHIVAPAFAENRTAVLFAHFSSGRIERIELPLEIEPVISQAISYNSEVFSIAAAECGALRCSVAITGYVMVDSVYAYPAGIEDILAPATDFNVPLRAGASTKAPQRDLASIGARHFSFKRADAAGLIAPIDATSAPGHVRVHVAPVEGTVGSQAAGPNGELAVIPPAETVVLHLAAGAAAAGGTVVVEVVDAAVLQIAPHEAPTAESLTSALLSYTPTAGVSGQLMYQTTALIAKYAEQLRIHLETSPGTTPTARYFSLALLAATKVCDYVTVGGGGVIPWLPPSQSRFSCRRGRPQFEGEWVMDDSILSMTNRGEAAGSGAASGGAAAIKVRESFRGTAFHRTVKLDASGSAVVNFTAPDNVGRWEVRAYAVAPAGDTAALAFASGRASFNARRPVSLTPVIPPAAHTGDIYNAGVLITVHDAAYPAGTPVRLALRASIKYHGGVTTGPDAVGGVIAGVRSGAKGAGALTNTSANLVNKRLAAAAQLVSGAPTADATATADEATAAGGAPRTVTAETVTTSVAGGDQEGAEAVIVVSNAFIGAGAVIGADLLELYAATNDGASASAVVTVRAGVPTRVLLPIYAFQAGQDKITFSVGVVSDASVTDLDVLSAAIMQTVGVAATNPHAPRDADAAVFDLYSLTHSPSTAFVAGFVLNPAADEAGVVVRQNGVVLPYYEAGTGRIDTRVTTSWAASVAIAAERAAETLKSTGTPRPLVATITRCLLHAYGRDGAIMDQFSSTVSAELSYASNTTDAWWARSAVAWAHACTNTASAFTKNAQASVPVIPVETLDHLFNVSVSDAVRQYEAVLAYGGKVPCPTAAAELLLSMGPSALRAAAASAIQRNAAAAAPRVILTAGSVTGGAGAGGFAGSSGAGTATITDPTRTLDSRSNNRAAKAAQAAADAAAAVASSPIGQLFELDYHLSAAMSGSCSLEYSLIVAAAAIWYPTQSNVFSDTTSNASNLATSIWAPMRNSIRVTSRTAYFAQHPGTNSPLSEGAHALFLHIVMGMLVHGSTSEVAVAFDASFSTDLLAYIVNHLATSTGHGTVAVSLGLHDWDILTNSASSPDLEVAVFFNNLVGRRLVTTTAMTGHFTSGNRGPLTNSAPIDGQLLSIDFEASGTGAATSILALSYVPLRREVSVGGAFDKGVTVTRTVTVLSGNQWLPLSSNVTLAVGAQLRVYLTATSVDIVPGLSITDRVPVAVEVAYEEPAVDVTPMPVFRRGMVESSAIRPGLPWFNPVVKTVDRGYVNCASTFARTVTCNYAATVTFSAPMFWWPAPRAWSHAIPEVFGEGEALTHLATVHIPTG